MTRKNSIPVRKTKTKPKPGAARAAKTSVPVSYGQTVRGSEPRYLPASKPNCLRIAHREYLGPAVAGSSAPKPLFGNGTPSGYSVTPLNANLFKFISDISARFERWRGSFTFVFRTSAPTGTGGSIYMAIDPDPNDGTASTIETMLVHGNTVSGPLYRDARISCGSSKWRHVSVKETDIATDAGSLSLSVLATLQLAIRAGGAYGNGPITDEIVGDLFCEYDIELEDPTNSLDLTADTNPSEMDGRVTELRIDGVTPDIGGGSAIYLDTDTWKVVRAVQNALDGDLLDFVSDIVFEGWHAITAEATAMTEDDENEPFNFVEVAQPDSVVKEVSGANGMFSSNYNAPSQGSGMSALYHVSGGIRALGEAVSTFLHAPYWEAGTLVRATNVFFPSAAMGFAAVAGLALDQLGLKTAGAGVYCARTPQSLDDYVHALTLKSARKPIAHKIIAYHAFDGGVRAHILDGTNISMLQTGIEAGSEYWSVTRSKLATGRTRR